MKYRSNLTGLILSVFWDYSLHCSTVAPEVCHCKYISSYSKLNPLHKNIQSPYPTLYSALQEMLSREQYKQL